MLSYRPKFVKVGSVRIGQLPVRPTHALWNNVGLAAVTGVAITSFFFSFTMAPSFIETSHFTLT